MKQEKIVLVDSQILNQISNIGDSRFLWLATCMLVVGLAQTPPLKWKCVCKF